MRTRNGCLVLFATVLLWMLPVSAEETAEEVVTMMAWWEEYGRYWDEIGTETSVADEDMAFAWLNALTSGSERGLP